MNMATYNSMKFLLQKNDTSMSIVLPKEMKEVVKKAARKNSMNPSQYAKLALIEKMDRER